MRESRLLALLIVLLIGLGLLLYFVLGIALGAVALIDASPPATELLLSGGRWLASLLIGVLLSPLSSRCCRISSSPGGT